jgi:hypothetical protein
MKMTEKNLDVIEKELESHAFAYCGSDVWQDSVTSLKHPVSVAYAILVERIRPKWSNEKPFRYEGDYGSVFVADRSDFKNGVAVKNIPSEPHAFASEVAAMIGYHATNIHPKLNGFQGYDCIHWIFKK